MGSVGIFSYKNTAIYLYYVANPTSFCFKGPIKYQKSRINFGFTTFIPYLCTVSIYLSLINTYYATKRKG